MVQKHGRKDLMTEAKSYLLERTARMDQLVEKWDRAGYGTINLAKRSKTRARNTATLLENQSKHLKKLSEAIISQNFQTRPENILKVVRIGSANSNRGDIFTEFPLTTLDDAIYFIDMIYESSLRGSTADQKIYENINRFYAGEMYEQSVSSSGTSHSITCGKAPIVKGKTFIMYQRAIVAVDNKEGKFTAVGTQSIIDLASSGITNYTTGAITVVTTTSVSSGDLVILTQLDSEKSSLYDQYGKVSLSVRKERFDARPMPLGYTYTSMTELLLGSEGLGNVEDMLIQTIGDEHAKSKDYKAIGIARSLALKNDVYTFDAAFADNGEVSDKSHAQKILPKIGSISGLLYDDLKRGKVNKAVAGSQALEYVKKHDLWKDDTSQNRVGVYLAGKLSDIDFYCCPADSSLVANNEILLTFKNPEEGLDIGLAFGVLTELTAALAYPQFYVDGNIASVEDFLPLNTKFMRLLTINNLSF